jgi:hypothetical protein
MDIPFLLRAKRMLGHAPAPMEHDVLLASLSAQQAASPTARAAARGRDCREPGTPIVELLLAGPAWRDAARAQQGCFNRSGRCQASDGRKSI